MHNTTCRLYKNLLYNSKKKNLYLIQTDRILHVLSFKAIYLKKNVYTKKFTIFLFQINIRPILFWWTYLESALARFWSAGGGGGKSSPLFVWCTRRQRCAFFLQTIFSLLRHGFIFSPDTGAASKRQLFVPNSQKIFTVRVADGFWKKINNFSFVTQKRGRVKLNFKSNPRLCTWTIIIHILLR